jgi:hypothetical protein
MPSFVIPLSLPPKYCITKEYALALAHPAYLLIIAYL